MGDGHGRWRRRLRRRQSWGRVERARVSGGWVGAARAVGRGGARVGYCARGPGVGGNREGRGCVWWVGMPFTGRGGGVVGWVGTAGA